MVITTRGHLSLMLVARQITIRTPQRVDFFPFFGTFDCLPGMEQSQDLKLNKETVYGAYTGENPEPIRAQLKNLCCYHGNKVKVSLYLVSTSQDPIARKPRHKLAWRKSPCLPWARRRHVTANGYKH